MKSQIDLAPEYWSALSIGSDFLGYFSRHEMVAEILKTWVDRQPGLLEKGKERVALEGKAMEVVMRDPRSLIVDIPNLNAPVKEKKHRFWYVDESKGYEDSLGPDPRAAYMKFIGKELTMAEFNELFKRYEVLS